MSKLQNANVMTAVRNIWHKNEMTHLLRSRLSLNPMAASKGAKRLSRVVRSATGRLSGDAWSSCCKASGRAFKGDTSGVLNGPPSGEAPCNVTKVP